jgi:vancomycin permeability regulator SanA
MKGSVYVTRQEIIDYISPETKAFRCEHALLFGSRHAQLPLVAETARLFKRRYFERILICGGRTRDCNTPEAVEIAEKLVAAGIPPGRIATECASTNTGENVMFARRIMGDTLGDIFLIGKIYAKRRYAMTVKAQRKSIQRVACHGINYFGVPRAQWWKSRELRAYVVSELRKIPKYVQLGYISEIAVRDGHIHLDLG